LQSTDILTALDDAERWGSYLTDLARRVRDLADEVHASAADPAARPRLPWAEAIADAPDMVLPGDLAVWRATLSIPDDDLQPTGPPRLADDAARHQYGLKRRVMRATQPMGEKPREWIRLLPPTVRRDPRVTVLCERLSTLHDAGTGVERLLRTAADLHRPLPAEQPADALWWRIVGLEARHRSTTSKAPRRREPETTLSREAERLRQVRKQEEAHRMLHRPDRPGPSLGR
jgi:hypothetical protein